MATTDLGIVYPDPSATPSRQAIEDLATSTDDALAAVLAQFTAMDYTPSPSNLTLGNGTLTGRYMKIGMLVHYRISMVFGTTTSVSGIFSFTLPIAATPAIAYPFPVGICAMQDVSASVVLYGLGRITSSIAAVTPVANDATPVGKGAGPSYPWAWEPGDTIDINGSYEPAA